MFWPEVLRNLVFAVSCSVLVALDDTGRSTRDLFYATAAVWLRTSLYALFVSPFLLCVCHHELFSSESYLPPGCDVTPPFARPLRDALCGCAARASRRLLSEPLIDFHAVLGVYVGAVLVTSLAPSSQGSPVLTLGLLTSAFLAASLVSNIVSKLLAGTESGLALLGSRLASGDVAPPASAAAAPAAASSLDFAKQLATLGRASCEADALRRASACLRALFPASVGLAVATVADDGGSSGSSGTSGGGGGGGASPAQRGLGASSIGSGGSLASRLGTPGSGCGTAASATSGLRRVAHVAVSARTPQHRTALHDALPRAVASGRGGTLARCSEGSASGCPPDEGVAPPTSSVAFVLAEGSNTTAACSSKCFVID